MNNSLIALIIAVPLALFVCGAGVFIHIRGGTWEDFWKGRLWGPNRIKPKDKPDESKLKLILGTMLGAVIILALFYVIMRGILGIESFDVSLMVAAGIMVATVIYTLLYHGVKRIQRARFKIDPQNEVRADGVVTKVIVVFESFVNHRLTRETLEVFVKVDGLDKPLSARVKVRYGKNPSGRRYKTREKVTVIYDKEKLRWCKIVD